MSERLDFSLTSTRKYLKHDFRTVLLGQDFELEFCNGFFF